MKRPEPRPPRETGRQKRSKQYALEWAEIRKNRRFVANRRNGRVLRAAEFIRALELARDTTGDPRFTDALEAARYYGLDREFQRTAARLQAKQFGNLETELLVQVEFLHRRGKLEANRRRKLSVREACEAVAAESGLPGSSFETVVERLRKQYKHYSAHPRSDESRVLNLETAMMSLLVRRIAEQEFLGQKPRKKKPIPRS